jgi:hypothetical protein
MAIVVNTAKCLFGVAEIPFVGHRVSSEGIAPLSSNVEAILRLTAPKSVSDLSTFLGMTNYLRFVEDYARISEPLRHLLRKEVRGRRSTNQLSNNFIQQQLMWIPSETLWAVPVVHTGSTIR